MILKTSAQGAEATADAQANLSLEAPTFTLTAENVGEVVAALSAHGVTEPVKSGHAYQVGTALIAMGFEHRTNYETAAWYQTENIHPQVTPVFRRHWAGLGDSEPFVEAAGTIIEHNTATLFGGVQVGRYDRKARAGEATSATVSLYKLPVGTTIKVGLPGQVSGVTAEAAPVNLRGMAQGQGARVQEQRID